MKIWELQEWEFDLIEQGDIVEELDREYEDYIADLRRELLEEK